MIQGARNNREQEIDKKVSMSKKLIYSTVIKIDKLGNFIFINRTDDRGYT